ncbi:hypothetical protein EYF80_017095 [Liparis tanakae]|uniref:Uncharacterized protein n=1 Tax=Liparis tanakae TaxID=230148 RepID=A0A4Z2I3J4_9TELE|nr:hypothetical protein EYF80_017095 [Liparis tanakae]
MQHSSPQPTADCNNSHLLHIASPLLGATTLRAALSSFSHLRVGCFPGETASWDATCDWKWDNLDTSEPNSSDSWLKN